VTRATAFTITLPPVQLEVHEVWPDDDAPRNPTAEDVVDKMRETGTPARVLSDWGLVSELEVYGLHDSSKAVLS
jgi:hypothetical protein